jgi:hypothetical protein
MFSLSGCYLSREIVIKPGSFWGMLVSKSIQGAVNHDKVQLFPAAGSWQESHYDSGSLSGILSKPGLFDNRTLILFYILLVRRKFPLMRAKRGKAH